MVMVTVEKKLINYLLKVTKSGEAYITSSEIENSIPNWVFHSYGDTHNGSTFGRAWRKLREKHNINIEGTMKLHDFAPSLNIHVKLDNKPNSREYRWKIQR
tara:strand:+ start:270 stop:572 length:303 start_codon:yes stop_codon:yes gene_type:complete